MEGLGVTVDEEFRAVRSSCRRGAPSYTEDWPMWTGSLPPGGLSLKEGGHPFWVQKESPDLAS